MPPEPGTAAALRGTLIAGLKEAIYAPPEAGPALPPEHDPALRRRTEAVELLGRFPDTAAVDVLGALLLTGERALPPPIGPWLRDTALLTLLQSPRLPRRRVDDVLRDAYDITRHLWPWQWSAVYDELPLLARYGRLGVFVRAFWLWPLLLGAVPTLVLLGQLLFRPAQGLRFDWLRDLIVTLGSALELLLVHQVVCALLAGQYGPPLRLPGRVGATGQAWAGLGLAVLVLGLLGAIVALLFTDSFQRSPLGAAALLGAVLVLPWVLLPMFMLAHDLEVAVRYARRRALWRTRLAAVLLRRLTDASYVFLLLALAGGVYPFPGAFGPAFAALLAYLLAVPFLVIRGLWLVTRLLDRAPTTPAGGS